MQLRFLKICFKKFIHIIEFFFPANLIVQDAINEDWHKQRWHKKCKNSKQMPQSSATLMLSTICNYHCDPVEILDLVDVNAYVSNLLEDDNIVTVETAETDE